MKKPTMPKEPERKMIGDIWEMKCEFWRDEEEDEDNDDCYNCYKNSKIDDHRCEDCDNGIYRLEKINLIDILNKYRNYDVNELKIEAEDCYIKILHPEPIEEFDARIRDYHEKMLEYDKNVRKYEEYNLPQNKALRDHEKQIKLEQEKKKMLAKMEEDRQKKIKEFERKLAELKGEKPETKRATKKGAKK